MFILACSSGDEDDAEDRQDGKKAEHDVPGGDHEDQKAEDHGNSNRDEGSVKETFLKIVKI